MSCFLKEKVMHKVSVITPVYNCAQYLEETVASVRTQNYADWELILWDDGSTDKTPEICRKLAEEDSRIRFFRSEKNHGVSLSRLSAVKHAEGRFLAFLDGDDVWSKDKLSTQVIFMLKNKYPISHTEYAFINAEGKLLPRGHLKVDREVDLKKLMKTTQLGLSTIMVDRRQIGKTVPFPEKRTLSEDTAAWMSLMRRGFKSYGIPRVMMLYRVRSSQLSGNKARMAFNMLNNYLREKSIPLHKRFYYWSCYAVNGFAKRLRKSGGIPAEILQNFDQRYNR